MPPKPKATQSTYREQKYRCRITFEGPLLGSLPANVDVYESYVIKKSVNAAKKQNESSMLAVANGHIPAPIKTVTGDDFDFVQMEQKAAAPDPEGLQGRSVFDRDRANRPLLGAYVVKGFLKETARARAKQGGITSTVAAYIQTIDLHLHILPPKLVLNTVHAEEVDPWFGRTLRAQTPTGPRNTLKSSEQVGPGTYLDFEIIVMLPNVVTEALLREWFDFGRYHGLGEWRNNISFGTFTYTLAASK